MPQFDKPINTNDQSIDRVLATPLPVVLAFSAKEPGTAMQLVLDEVAREQAGNLLVAKVQTVDNPASASRFGVNGEPTIVTWKEGKEQVRLVDPMPNDVRAAVDHVLGRGPAPKVAPRPQPESAQQAKPSTKQPSGNAGHPITVSEANFEQQVLHSDEPVLVDFWAPWCGPCRMVAPTLEKLGKEYAGKIKVAKLNVDDNQRLAMKYGARSIPLLVMFKNGKPVQQLVGAHPEPNIRGMIEKTIG